MDMPFPKVPLKRLMRPTSAPAVSIKGHLDELAEDEGVPGYSASGQDVRLPVAQFHGDGIVLSAVGAQCGKCFHATGGWGVVANTYPFLPTDNGDARYLFYLVNQKNFWEIGGTAQPYVQVPRTMSKAVPAPPLRTQKRIARFLDEKTAHIDALIGKKRTLLDRLAEKRQALITQAVTRGLDPSAPMKDSGIEWLGDIPAHWEPVALNKLTTKITNGYVGPTRDIFIDDGVRYIQSLHIKQNRIIFKNDFFVSEEWSQQHAKSILKTGDVLIVQTGDIGQVAVVPPEFEGCNCHALIVCTPRKDRLMGRFLAWLLCSDYGQQFLHMVKTGALHPHLNCGNVKFFPVVISTLAEQEKISSYLDERMSELAEIRSSIEESISLLTEYRAALITAAVTGKLDVSGGSKWPSTRKPRSKRPLNMAS